MIKAIAMPVLKLDAINLQALKKAIVGRKIKIS
jgi:hypothetical protein